MKLMSFEQRGRQAWGVVRGEEVVDLSGVWPDLRTALEGRRRAHRPGGRPRRHALYAPGGPAMAAARAQPAQDSVRGPELWPPRAGGRPRLPAHPSLFIRYADSFVGHGQGHVEAARLRPLRL